MAASPETQKLHALGNYRMAHLLGWNGVVATYKAFEQETLLPVCLVAMHNSAVKDEAVWEKFHAEFQALVNLAASRLCQPFASGNSVDHFWAAYEWQTGQHLGMIVRDYGLPSPPEAFRWMGEAAEALATLHRRGQAHRVVSPASIFITDFNQAKLLHAAWGRMILAVEGGAQAPEFMSILPFLSPEVALGNDADVSADVYGIGASLYFLLTGAPPFWHDDTKELLKLIEGGSLDLSELTGLITPDGVEVLEELLQRQPEDRPINLPALADRLNSLSLTLQRLAEAVLQEPEQPPITEDEDTERLAGVQRDDATNAEGLQADYTQQGGTEGEEYLQQGYGDELDQHMALPVPDAAAAAERSRAVALEEVEKRSRTFAMILGAGIVLAAASLLLAAGLVYILTREGEPDPPATTQQQTPQRPRIPTADDIRKFDETLPRLRALGQLARGYHRQHGTWPDDFSQLVPLGAHEQDFKDAWGRDLEIREEFIVSAGADGEWDTRFDFWYDAEVGISGGFSPTIQEQ